MQLEHIAEIKTGIVLTRKKADVDLNVKAKYRLLTLKNINDDGTFNNEEFELFESNDILSPHYFTEEGDVIIRLSHPNTAIYIDESHSGLLVPSYFAIIKVDKIRCLPAYLAWYLNTEAVKKELERSQAGSRIPTTNKNTLKAITIHDIPIQRQEALIQLLLLHQKEKQLYQKLIEEKEKWFKSITDKIIQGEIKEEVK
ncbi:restriction endonuclease subunit S [Halalkalibacterium halodurans]|uniref:restriction endonuclease subunit S n=1 Tax=Halalkalibacterium halodurans TaxID=86665 RepID=UPI0010FE21DA|nr:restriction endonuclease subunit S [Halalkalibacterium halodurans]